VLHDSLDLSNLLLKEKLIDIVKFDVDIKAILQIKIDLILEDV
jgi:hypothetical protein